MLLELPCHDVCLLLIRSEADRHHDKVAPAAPWPRQIAEVALLSDIQATQLEATSVYVASADMPGQVTRQKRLVHPVSAPPSGQCPAQSFDSRLAGVDGFWQGATAFWAVQKAVAPCQKLSTPASAEAAGVPYSPSLRPDALKGHVQAGTANSSSKKPPGSLINSTCSSKFCIFSKAADSASVQQIVLYIFWL